MSADSIPSNLEHLYSVLGRYVDQGFAVLPLYGIRNGHCTCSAGRNCDRSQGKHPNAALVPNGFYGATRDKSVLNEWIRRFPNGNWGARAGLPLANGKFLVVVDVDPRNGGDTSIAQIQGEQGNLPQTWTQDTGGNGNHYLLGSDAPCAARTVAPGIDILGEGKYFVIYPSTHESGGQYSWALGLSPDDVPLADAPGWLIEASTAKARPSREEGTARDTVLGEAFAIAGMLGVPFSDGSIAVRCPWAEEHSDNRGKGEDSSTVILPPAGGSLFGGFKCLHSHCTQRKWQDVMQSLPPSATMTARRKFPLKAVELEDLPPMPPLTGLSDEDTQTATDAVRLKLSYKTVKGGSKLQNDIVNAVTILTYDPRWRNLLKFDSFSQRIVFTRQPIWHPDDTPVKPFESFSDAALNCMDTWFRRYYGLEIEPGKILQAVVIVSGRDAVNPLQDWLNGLTWDKVPRLDEWTSRYLGSDSTPYSRVAGRKWMISAVARGLKPGCKADHVLVLEGDQGRGKSTALGVLASEPWFTDTPIDIGNKDAYLAIQGKWIVELGELTSLKRADIDRAKAFFTSPSDRFRSPYGRTTDDYPRMCIFAGTVNPDEYLTDPTGNRRFWPLKCGVIDLAALAEDRAQLWAEAVHLYKEWVARGSRTEECLWWPHYDERHLFTVEQAARVIPDSSWEEVIATWLANSHKAKRELRDNNAVSARLILEDALEIPVAEHDGSKQIRLGKVMAALLWVRARPRHVDGASRLYAYKPSSLATAR